ncbi:uncharacterized protein K02A2.6-like [Xenia sp. Carnegie-2017]|uniref:uncharacterized protein K02A2.6-like n=1 Tax=Xenia sp. Carnegie-2017 TaxID=2897299 RepID=UPI001F04647E|nr:uncharacterized protein K02A2.6-like [Xenia sp. Carnegie-2017]
MEKFRPPDPLIFEGNLSDLWDRWKQQFELYLVATESHEKTEDIKTSIFLTCIGKHGIEIYNTFTFSDEADKLKLKPVLEKFEAYYKPRKNITLLRHNFLTHKQHDGVTFDAFVTELKRRSAQCEFGDLRESHIRDMIVIGVSDNPLRERLLRTETLTLENAIKIGQASEATKQQAMTLSRPHTGNQNNVNELRTKSNNTRRPRQQSAYTSASSQARSNCKYCGEIHQRGKCPAYGKTCSKCHKLNHFASVCLSTSRSVHYTTEGHEGHDYEIASDANNIFIGTLSTEVTDNSVNTANITQDGNRDWIISLRSNESVTRFKIDTGAQANVIPMGTIEKLATRPHIEKTNTTLTAYNGMNIPVVGKCTLNIQHNNQTHAIPFVVANTTSLPLIGLQTSIDLNLIKRVWTVNAKTPNFIQEYKDVFGELGCLKGEHHISIDPNVTPVVHPPRKIPISLMERLKAELKRMCKLDVIEKVDEPTDWVSSMVVVEKDNGQLRICLDPKDLNTAIKRHHYPMPTVDEVLSKLGGATIFTKLDASSGYWQVKVDEASSKLLAFNTPFGRYCFKRLAFGIHSAVEVFQKKVAEIIDGIPNAANDQDDIIVFGRNKEQHDKALKDILDRVRKSGLKLNEKKCRFGFPRQPS